ncbi:hypothetical protein ACXR2U_11970 [Jatrophihabitans sp. YIM 134969]
MRMRVLVTAVVTGAVVLGLSPGVADAAPATTRVAGVLQYTTSDGRHPFSRGVTVQVRDADGTAGGTLLGTVTTDDVGIFSLDVTTKRPNGQARRPFARALSRSAGFTVHASGSTAPYAAESTPTTATGATQSVRLKVGNSTAAETAFGVTDALVTGVRYAARLGVTMPALSVSFPDAKGTNATAALLRVQRLDQFDWDVLLHEYGHAVADALGVDKSPGGTHGFGQNVAEPPRSKLEGLRLAWSEGFATYFSLTAQDVLGASSQHVPGAGDDFFDDTQDASSHVAIGTDVGIISAGEDDELSIARSLWHFRVDARTRIPDVALVKALRAAGVSTFSGAVAALLPAANAARFDGSGNPSAAQVAHSNDFACVLSRQKVSPLVTAPADGDHVSLSEPPTFTWQPRGAGPSHRLTRFVVQVWSSDWSKARFTSPTTTATTFTPTAAQWRGVLKPSDTGVHVVVRGRSVDAPATGPYNSCAVDLTAGGGLTATPVGTRLHPAALIPACAGLTSPFDSMFRVAGSDLSASATYDIVLHTDDGAWPDVALTSATTNAGGDLPSTLAVLRNIPSGRHWVVVAKPREDGDIGARVGLQVLGLTCYKGDPDHPNTVVWGGVGALPGTTVTEALNGTTVGTAVADSTATYQASYTVSCTGSKTALVSYTDLDGPQTITFQVSCPHA